MTAFTTKPDLRDVTSTQRIHTWKSLTIQNGDTLKSGFKEVWCVVVSEPAALSSWSVSSGTITFVTTQDIGPGPVVVYGR